MERKKSSYCLVHSTRFLKIGTRGTTEWHNLLGERIQREREKKEFIRYTDEEDIVTSFQSSASTVEETCYNSSFSYIHRNAFLRPTSVRKKITIRKNSN